MKSPRVVAVVTIVALSGCSIVLDPTDLGRGVPVKSDATADGGPSTGVDASTGDELAESPDVSTDDTNEAFSDTAVDVSAAFDASAEGEAGAAAVDAAVDVDAIATAVDAGVDAAVDAAVDAGADAAPVDAAMGMDVGADVAQFDAGPGSLGMGLVAFYPFDEASGTTAADGSGNGQTATMNGATFAPGQRGNAAALDGTNQYVSLPTGIVSSLTQCSISFWVNLVVSSARGHIFDWGTGNTAYMSISNSQFVISVGGINAEQRIKMPSLPTGSWRHVVVTLAGSVGTIYVNGAQAGQNTGMTLTPSSLGMTTRNWLGRSQDPTDLYLTGQIDEFRIYRRALTPAEVQQLFQLRL